MIDPETFEAILVEIAAGEATHRAVESKGLNRRDFYALIGSDIDASNRYARAKLAGLDRMADEIIEIADDSKGDVETRIDSNGEPYVVQNQEFAARSRLRVDTRKWLLSKLAPKKYGERIEHAGDAANPISVVIGSVDAKL